jgi:hypothetical protein
MNMNTGMDMAICLVLFNPANSKRMLMNYHYIVNEFKLQNLPVFTLELVYADRTPQIANAIHVTSKSYMFSKENMCRVLEKYIPPKFTKLAFLDADLTFKDKDWYSKTSKLLNSHDVVQPFETSLWLDLTYKLTMQTKQSILLLKTKTLDWHYHPGFVWCFKREWYKKHGFFDLALGGGGDSASCVSWLKLNHSLSYLAQNKIEAFTEFSKKCPMIKITYLKDSTLYHLYHGSKKNRQYVDRKKIFDGCPDIRTMIFTNSHGIYEWNDKYRDTMNKQFLKYFIERDDDDLSI